MRVIDCEQHSEAWFQARLGKVTASRVGDVIGTLKSGGYRAERARYMTQLMVERLTGIITESFVSPAMQWGSATEAQALAAYEFEHDLEVQRIGFVLHPSIDDAGASPDGLVGDDGMVQVKCPTTAVHLESLLEGDPTGGSHLPQVMWEMACTGRQWSDLVLYDPRVPPALRMVTVRVQRDEKAIAAMELAVGIFLGELAEKVEKLMVLAGGSFPKVDTLGL